MTTLKLSESETTTVVVALAHENTNASMEVLAEIVKQGATLPAWIRADLDRYGRIASWRGRGVDPMGPETARGGLIGQQPY